MSKRRFARLLIILLFGTAGLQLSAHARPEVQIIASGTLPNKFKFQKTRFGGISGLAPTGEPNQFYAVSDDRGRVDEPRIYMIQFEKSGRTVEITPKAVIRIKDLVKNKRKLHPVFDLEGITGLPWGNLLISSEGDLNAHPRVLPALIEIKKSGEVVRDFDLPPDLLPESSGQLTKGIQNNLGIEGLTSAPSGKIYSMVESYLKQDQVSQSGVRLIEWDAAEAWTLKPGREWYYPLSSSPKGTLDVVRGVSEILALSDHQILVLERSLELSLSGVEFDCRLYLIDLQSKSANAPNNIPILPKTEILNFKTALAGFDPNIKADNFEAMGVLSQTTKDGLTEFEVIVASDDNFSKQQKNLFLWLKIKGI